MPESSVSPTRLNVKPPEPAIPTAHAGDTEQEELVGEAIFAGPDGHVATGRQLAPEQDSDDVLKPNCWELLLYGETFGSCCPCLTFFAIGWLFFLVLIITLAIGGNSLFSFEEHVMTGNLQVQQYFAHMACLRDSVQGCRDHNHSTEERCVRDKECQWDEERYECQNLEVSCSKSSLLRPREAMLESEFGSGFVMVFYEAQNGANILDSDILALIHKFEKELLTTVNGAKTKRDKETESYEILPWDEDYCMLTYPDYEGAAGKCRAVQSLMNLFSMTDHGRQSIKNQVENGFTSAGPLSCICSDDAQCSICNADGSLKGASMSNPVLAWPADVGTCVSRWLSLESNTAAPSSANNSDCDESGAEAGRAGRSGANLELIPMLQQHCLSNQSCQWSPPEASQMCSSTAFYHATDGNGLVAGQERENVLQKLCDPKSRWHIAAQNVLKLQCDSDPYAQVARTQFAAGGTNESEEFDHFKQLYVMGHAGWLARARLLEEAIEKESKDKLRILLIPGAAIMEEYLGLLGRDALLSIGSLLMVWFYMWFTFESCFLALCGIFEIIFSLPVAWCILIYVFQKQIFWYQVLCIYMILGIGADDVFILHDAWVQSAYQAKEISKDPTIRFAWAYRKSFHAMAITSATTCGSFLIGALSPLPQVQGFCIFAAIVVFVDWIFCVTFFASALHVHEKVFKGWALMVCCQSQVREPGQCLGPGCCCGGFRAMLTCGGRHWKMMPKPVSGGRPQPRAMEKFFSEQLFNFHLKFSKILLLFWFFFACGMGVSAGLLLRPATKQPPMGREHIDVTRATELSREFGKKQLQLSSISFGLHVEDPIEEWSETRNIPRYGGSAASDLKMQQKQLELLQLCKASDLGDDVSRTRCMTKKCLIMGSALPQECNPDQITWKTRGIYMPADILCNTGRYCIMEDIANFWAFNQGNCSGQGHNCTGPGCSWDDLLSVCHSNSLPGDYPGLDESVFMDLLASDEWTTYLTGKAQYLRENGRSWDADDGLMTGIRLNAEKTDITSAWISYNASAEYQETIDQANEWLARWTSFKTTHGPTLGGFQTMPLYVFLATQNELLKAAASGIGFSLLITYIVLLAATMNFWTATIGLITVGAITTAFVGLLPLVGWSLGDNECIFLIATVGLSVDYTVHLLHSYSSAEGTSREKVQHALAGMGISVANSAITTLLAACVLFQCGFYVFFQFGGFIFMVIALSILMSTNLLMPLLLHFGPEAEQGMLPCRKRKAARVTEEVIT
mmetsp:Transcript_2400/g.4386  ORF Transcript_2400/g.4386 Transcript_2400/m.4386 type:complete len:1251 (-) Transcript_2400:68-3820(-)